jgi:hypothetical protein
MPSSNSLQFYKMTIIFVCIFLFTNNFFNLNPAINFFLFFYKTLLFYREKTFNEREFGYRCYLILNLNQWNIFIIIFQNF